MERNIKRLSNEADDIIVCNHKLDRTIQIRSSTSYNTTSLIYFNEIELLIILSVYFQTNRQLCYFDVNQSKID